MKGKFFLDTNIFVYSFDSSHLSKQKKAQALIELALTENNGVISYQVIQEFLNVASKKFTKPMTNPELILFLEEVLLPLCDFYPNEEFYSFGLEVKERTKFSFHDSLIVAAALKLRCKFLYSEDLQHQQVISGLTIKNPFD